MKRLLWCALALAASSVARADGVVSIPTDGPALTHVGQKFNVPVSISGFTNPTRKGGQLLEVNVVASQGLSIELPLLIGPWTISGNPVQYYGNHNYYVDLFEQVNSFIIPSQKCITESGGVAFSLRVVVNQFWYGGHETLRLGKSVKETGPEPKLLDCSGVVVPTTYGNKTCVFAPAVLGVAGGATRQPPTEWYDVAGRKLEARPTGSGIYFQRVPGSSRSKVVVLR
jgi:hypothetical protein